MLTKEEVAKAREALMELGTLARRWRTGRNLSRSIEKNVADIQKVIGYAERRLSEDQAD